MKPESGYVYVALVFALAVVTSVFIIALVVAVIW